MALLGDFFNNPSTILGLSVLNSANRPAAGLLSGLSAYNTLQQQNLQNQALISNLAARNAQARQQEMQRQAAMRFASQNQNLMAQPYVAETGDTSGAAQLAQLIPQQESKIGKINPEGWTPESVAQFEKTGDYGVLIPSARGPSQVINVNAELDPFTKSLQGELGKDFVKGRIAAQQAADSLSSINQSLGLINKGMVTGTGARALTYIGGALKQIGFDVETDPIANAQAYGAVAAKRTAQIIQDFGAGTGLSDADREYAMRAAAGDIEMQPQALVRMLEINAKASRNIINRYNAQAQAVMQTKPVPYPLTVDMPEYPKFGAVQDQTVSPFDQETEDLLNKYGQ